MSQNMEGEYYKSKASVQEYIKLSDGVSGAELIDKLKVELAPGSSLLEIGSGPGTDWEILSRTYKVQGSDFSNEFLAHLRKAYPTESFLTLDAATLKTDLLFDGIYSNKVLHHLTDQDLQQSVDRQAAILNPKGIICHSFWKGEGSETFKGMFVNYHNEEVLKGLFDTRFDILLLESYAEFEAGDSLLLIGRKK